jgi:hypothetical protein
MTLSASPSAILEPVVGLPDGVERRSLSELLHHEDEGARRLAHELRLPAEHLVGDAARVDRQPLDDLLDLLRDAVERDRQRLEVLPVEGRDEVPAQRLGHQVPDALFLAPGLDEVVEAGGLLALVHLAQGTSAKRSTLTLASSAPSSNRSKKGVVPTYQLLEEVHPRLLRACYGRGDAKHARGRVSGPPDPEP